MSQRPTARAWPIWVGLGSTVVVVMLSMNVDGCETPRPQLESAPATSTTTQQHPLDDVDAVGVGWQHACVLRRGEVWCWGNATFSGGNAQTPANLSRIAIAGSVQQLAVTAKQNCALLEDGTAWCWGENNDRCSNPARANEVFVHDAQGRPPPVLLSTARPRPERVGTDDRLTSLSLGTAHGCATTESGTLLCWGLDFRDAYGDACAPLHAPTTVIASGVTSVKTGHFWTCATANGERRCFGDAPSAPLLEVGIADHTAFNGMVNASCGLVEGGVSCEGSTDGGLLGVPPGQPPLFETPTRVAGLDGAQSLSLGTYHGCVRVENQARCWGGNAFRQSDPASDDAWVPATRIDLPAPVIDVQTGTDHARALLRDRTVRCWGRNLEHQVGVAARSDHEPPTAIVLP